MFVINPSQLFPSFEIDRPRALDDEEKLSIVNDLQ